MAAGYLEILRARHAARLLTGTLVGRLPNATAAIAVVLFIRAEGGTYSLAGALAAVYGVANAVGQPLLGRLVDLYGQPRVQLPAALVSALAMTAFALSGTNPLPPAYVSMAVAGLFTPPLEGGLRALWPSVLRREDQVHTAYAMDAVAQEVMFTVGPLLVTLCVALWSAQAALVVLNVIGVLGALSVVVSPPSRAWRSAPREAHWLGALRSPGLLALLGAFLFVGLALGSITVAGVSYADDNGGDAVYGWLMAALGLGALVGGTVYGARQWGGAPERRLRGLVALLAVCYLPLVLVPGPVAMTALTALAGVFLAPCIACAFIIVDRHAPSGTVTEAFSWLVTTFTVGASVGTGLAGPVVEWGGTLWGFAVPGVAGAVSLLVLLATGRVLAAPAGGPVVAASSENDPNRAVEPRFSSGDRA
ncbi:putative transmembrane transport protein [Streptomyces avermitilis MA-4680 = NBRC 14893]|uniref:Transmembrane transport protein n=1 Tax=Streptomyces avermitilis (strain ATCC 31267 / DSM 46492 / JCM 5070 / NBRC 14893 / NCIMB 12804 / NRRL 8165 / MA-4680) TaxID=227882 RepID=Q828I5_STRAW|nr:MULTISPECIES: MFS transporter [Streptomyces]MYT02227.1 MFS transporter [Streptomyces sp. SID5469]BAC74395.1 putative transmembrane transport protein [Streptomyces avermitilis MA-4680 = NBRC 14893]